MVFRESICFMAKKKKLKVKKRTRRLKDKRQFKLKLKKTTVFSIVQIIFYSLSGLVIVSFSRQGLALIKLNDFLAYLFGWTAVFLPFILVSFGLTVSTIKIFLNQPNVIIGTLLSFISIIGLTRAGILGFEIWASIEELATPIGSFIILSASTIIGFVVLFNTSIDVVITFLVKVFRRFILKPRVSGVDKDKRVSTDKDIKIFGGDTKDEEKPEEAEDAAEEKPFLKVLPGKPLELEHKLAQNMPGDEIVWKYPPTSILTNAGSGKADRGDIKDNAATIERTLDSFGINAKVVEINLGPAVTQYALDVSLGTKLSRITALERDLALALAAPTGTIRIEAPVPGRSLVGIELPNRLPEFVPIKKILEGDEMKLVRGKLAVSLGMDVSGKPVIADLARMPHVLIAGQTGSGKSVAINTFLSTILFRASPYEVKFIMVDPKRVELTSYNNIPHLLAPVIVDPEKVVSSLKWLMKEMRRRYELFEEAGVKNIETFNDAHGYQVLPYIVLLVDELADIMLYAPVEVEDSITRIAQMSRATGIHMVLATQRPSVDVITGLIKANIPCRIAFAVASQVDSRVILDSQGADKLLGRGDMLYLPPDQAKPIRIQGAFISDRETSELVKFLKNQGVEPQYTEEVTSMTKSGKPQVQGIEGDADELFGKALELIVQYDTASASMLQRRLSIGYARAARILDQLEASGAVAGADGSKPRDVLIKNANEILGGENKQ
jgi:DNA segregation ATPase FtsK/SpoIIIE, S-DNA-T family